MRKRLLVTGGAGFIGSNFIRYILNRYPDYEIVNLDVLTYSGNLPNLDDIKDNENYRFIQGSICDKELVKGLVAETDYVINFAAQSHVDRSITNPTSFIDTNVFGTCMILEAVRKNSNVRLLHISTDEVYGSIKEGKFTEESSLSPNSPYSASKASADLLALSYAKTYGLDICVTRSSNNFGPYQYPEKLIPLFITNLFETQKVPVYGDGQNVRNWIYVLDNCKAIDVVLHKGLKGEVYNIGGEVEVANIDITNILLKLLGKKEDLIEYVKDRPGHDRRYALNSSKIKQLGWKCENDFQQALNKTVEWYRNNEKWWRPLKEKLNRDKYHWLKRGD